VAWVAYGDESTRSGPGTPVYILAAAVLSSGDGSTVRASLMQLAKPRRRFHWRDADVPERHKAIELVAGLPALHFVVMAAGIAYAGCCSSWRVPALASCGWSPAHRPSTRGTTSI
jgi:hypothetical protein